MDSSFLAGDEIDKNISPTKLTCYTVLHNLAKPPKPPLENGMQGML